MSDLSIAQLILNASLPVQMVMLLLFLVSIHSWSLIFQKSRILKSAKKKMKKFESDFWKSKDISVLYNRVTNEKNDPIGLSSLFVAGYVEYGRLRKQLGITPEILLDGTQRAMQIALSRQVEKLEEDLSTLATVGSVSPYVGLFGTVWGIMHSFHGLGAMQQATLAMVAPGISEALIATAMGLFAAIPAVMAYNNYVDEVDRLIARYETFLDEFIGVLQRQSQTVVQATIPVAHTI